MNDRKAVLGFGNILMHDDGLGPYVIKMLESTYEFGEGLMLHDIGTPGLGIDQYLAGLDVLIIVDTVRATGSAGEVRTYRLPEILKYAPGVRMSPHDPGLKEALLSLEFSGVAPSEVLLVGVIPADVSTGVGLSEPVRAAVQIVMSEVVTELIRHGVRVTKRLHPKVPDVWWETATDALGGPLCTKLE